MSEKHDPPQRLRLEIHGAVQGVGFRPFIYRLATDLKLNGWVINDTQGVFIEVEGTPSQLTCFLERLPAEKPPQSIIHSLETAWLEPVGFVKFKIRHSDQHGQKTVLILPDLATCPDCLCEIFDPTDRRYYYPFTNCTNCGPRFSIIEALPYDRPNTSMRGFVMCPTCQAEYENPLDRRFHAQPNACPVCGPQLDFGLAEQSQIEIIQNLKSNIEHGEIVAVKGLGGFHLMVDATNATAVAKLRERKLRPDKPLAVMARDLAQARTLCQISPVAADLLMSPQSPIVLLPRLPHAPIATNVAPNNRTLGVMLPYTPLHHLILRELDFPVVATSGNLTDEPICTDEQEAPQRLGHIADAFLVHNRPIVRHVDDSVAWLIQDKPQLLRRARGYAPLPIRLPQAVPTILALGAHLKNTVALSVGRQVFISQHIGDLATAESLGAFERVIADFLRLYEAEPVAIAHDLHPDFLKPYRFLETYKIFSKSKIAIQHHHAHLAACLAENGLTGSVLGVTWDGTGYGIDGTIWGGEFLLGDAVDFKRVAHLRPFRLPGGDMAIKEPRRVALALLWELYGEAMLEQTELAPLRAFRAHERQLLTKMLNKGLNSPITTSAGRLFDGVAALIGLSQQVSFEGQAAMQLEFIADPTVTSAYPIEIKPNEIKPNSTAFILDWQPMVEAILADLQSQVDLPIISARFHNALVESIVAVAQIIGEPRVALTGGCFQNRWLVERTAFRLNQAGHEVLLHRQVPPNDGGISLGQVVVAAAKLTSK